MTIGAYNIRPFVVTLQECQDKTDFIRSHFRERGLDGVECFNGIHAAVSGVNTKHLYCMDDPGGWPIGPKPVSNWLSFWALWSAMQYMPDSHFLTLEWDAEFDPDWLPRAEEAMRSVPPDFDLLLWGSCCAQDKADKKHIAGNVYDVRYPHCGHATVVARKALPIMLSTQRKIYAPMDLSLMFGTFPLLKVYTVLPRLCGQFNTNIAP